MIQVRIMQNQDCESPREWDNLGTMYCEHSRYTLGDKDAEDPRDLNQGDFISLPLYLYDHSGLTINTTGFSCPWDSGQVGVIFITLERIRKEYGVKRISKKMRERVIKYLIGEVETYDQYLTGDIYGFSIEEIKKCTKCKEEHTEHIDSCWGFYGSDPKENGMLENIEEQYHKLLLNADIEYN